MRWELSKLYLEVEDFFVFFWKKVAFRRHWSYLYLIVFIGITRWFGLISAFQFISLSGLFITMSNRMVGTFVYKCRF